MNKLFTIPLAALLLTACSDNSYTDQPTAEDEVARSFLTVSILSPKSSTRADEVYQDGENYENNINTIRFYFFYDGGNPAPVWKQSATNTYLSYIDWTPTQSDLADGPVTGQTVEKIVTATLGINMPAENQGYPDLVLAIINPTPDVLALSNNPSLSDFTNHVDDYYTDLHDNNFVITNSVYCAGETPSMINATPIDEKCFQQNAEEAEKNQLVIYVERVLARLDLSINMKEGIQITETDNKYTIYPVGEETLNDPENSEKEPSSTKIYVHLLGWNITQTPNRSNLIKDINSQWSNELFGIEPWNSSDYHRSFWAINPPKKEFDYLYGSWNNPDTEDGGYYATALPIPDENPFETVYLQENAAPFENNASGPLMPTEVILAAQLVDADGKPLTIVRWANRYYTENGIKNAVANTLQLYSKSDDTYTKIEPSQLQFVTAQKIYGKELPENEADYYVYLQLTKDAQDLTWYNGNNDSATSYDSYKDVNKYIIDRTNFMMVWNSGQTYYYFEVKHLGEENNSTGYYGIVRNHLYKANLTSIVGLGTPVYDPDQTIIPEKPTGDDSVLSVEINVLQWRVVSNSYDLVWP